MKFGVPNNGDSFAGSVTNTSSAAPAICPESSPSFSAASSISPPRAQLTIRTPFLVLARFSADRMLRVWSVSGVCSVMKSARASSSSSVTLVTPSSTARSSVRNGSNATTFIFSPSARSATIEPMLPAPISPSVLPVTSTPMKRFFSHLPACVEASASGSWRASANISAMACSAVVIELPNGVFITTTPLALAAGMSTLSTPIPARPTTFRLVACSRISLVTLVELRMASPSYSPMIAFSSSGVLPVISSTSTPRSRKISAARGSILSEISTLGMGMSFVESAGSLSPAGRGLGRGAVSHRDQRPRRPLIQPSPRRGEG